MLDKINRAQFYSELKGILRVDSWTQSQVQGLDRLFDGFERDPLIPSGKVGTQRVAYWIYTDFHETGGEFQPVKERGGKAYYVRMYGPKTARGRRLGNDTDEEAIAYSGKGDVQLTGENNFEAAEEMIRDNYPNLVAEFEARTGKKFDLTVGDQPNDIADADNALDPQISLAILVAGTTQGMFGPPLGRFINANKCDYYQARRSVNVLDVADRFKLYCPKIEAALLRAQVKQAEIKPLADLPDTKVEVTSEGVKVEAASPTQDPVPGGGPSDPVVKANKQSLITKIVGWASGGTFVTYISQFITQATGFSPEAQVVIMKGLFALIVLAIIIMGVDHIHTKWTRSRRDLLNVK